MRKEIWAAVTAVTLMSNLSIAAELQSNARPALRQSVRTSATVYSPIELRARLVPGCSESFSAVLLRCPRLVYVYPPYDLGAVIQLKTLPPRKWRPYNQLFSWSRYD